MRPDAGAVGRIAGVVLAVVGGLLVLVNALPYTGWSLRVPTSVWLLVVGLLAVGVAAFLTTGRGAVRVLGGMAVAAAGLVAATHYLLGGGVIAAHTLHGAGHREARVTEMSAFGPDLLWVIEVYEPYGPLVHVRQVGCVSDDAVGYGGTSWVGPSLRVSMYEEVDEKEVWSEAYVRVSDGGRVESVSDPHGVLNLC
ncbi:hypothetical protein [Luteipulveratus flavus]|uniref:Uncharacterized protein n=1 Tax=Luteipulveratus flavus TaxID=3031728 RepID=A0ABT6C3Q1_9MICO|nr:hypothetical protein [Luteipulveratus sp. YIM 133296]MDF8263581.1 hypothetical protein [Luteipulveratus sp. YIM 133296]